MSGLGIAVGVLSVVCVLLVVILIGVLVFCRALYNSARDKQKLVFRLVDMLLEVNVYMSIKIISFTPT